MVDPSARLLPGVIADNDALYNLATSDWKENGAFETPSNTTIQQLTSFAMIVAYLYLGTSAVESHAMVPLGALTLATAGSSLMGYFGTGSAPIAKLLRTNMMNAICACIGAGSLLSSGLDLHIFLLTVLHMFDAFTGMKQKNNESQDSEFQRHNEPTDVVNRDNGPILSFFTESWKVNSIHKKDQSTYQTVQICLFGAQIYMALIAMISGNSVGLMTIIITMILAGAYSFFSPV